MNTEKLLFEQTSNKERKDHREPLNEGKKSPLRLISDKEDNPVDGRMKIGTIVKIKDKNHKVLTTRFWRPNKKGTFVVVSDMKGNFFDYDISKKAEGAEE